MASTSTVRDLWAIATAEPIADDDLQQVVYDLVRARILRMVGPGGSFAITLRSNNGDALFSETIAEAIAWDVSIRVETPSLTSARLTD
ncbi:MAG: hypothetical protein QOI02_1345 [Actinomycetota bacterium]|nr:hypothetical protein [Actinomycetota bacterium]